MWELRIKCWKCFAPCGNILLYAHRTCPAGLYLPRGTVVSYLFSVAMGFLQGVAEFLPISSSGHLALFQYFSADRIRRRPTSSLRCYSILEHWWPYASTTGGMLWI